MFRCSTEQNQDDLLGMSFLLMLSFQILLVVTKNHGTQEMLLLGDAFLSLLSVSGKVSCLYFGAERRMIADAV